MEYGKQWLIEHLNEILALEVEIYNTKLLMEHLESSQIPVMNVPDKFVPPMKPSKPNRPKDPSLYPKPTSSSANLFSNAASWTQELLEERALVAGIVLLIAGIIAALWFGSFLPIILLPLVGVGGAYVVCFIIGLFVEQTHVRHDENRYNSDLRDHEAQKRKNQQDYENLCRQTLINHGKEIETQQQKFVERKNEALVNNQLAFLFNRKIRSAKLQLEAQLIVMNESLKSLYKMNVLYPKYRNLVAVSYIAECLDSGRRHKLEAAYREYEWESRQDRIIYRLDVIIEKLDQIKDMQYKLYVEMVRANEILTTIKSSIHDGFRTLETQAKANTQRFLELSGNMAQMNLDMENCFQEVEGYLAKLEKTSDKALAYLKEQKK